MKRIINPIGSKYGKLLVLEEISYSIVSKQKYRNTLLKLKCKCDCGNIVMAFKGNILYGKTTQCRNCQNSHIVLGEKRGSLTILSRVNDEKRRIYLCECDCGSQDNYGSRFLSHGKNLSCKKCKFPKKFGPQIPKKTRKQAIADLNYTKHLRSKSSLIGKKNGRLKIIAFSHWEQKKERRRAYYKAKCKCGNEIIVRDCFAIKSCGCLQRETVPKGQDKHNAKLNSDQVKAIREFKKANVGYTGRQLADMFQVSEHLISNILLNKTYKE
jgi:hypothetical protein